MLYPVSEIFRSVQGEGFWTGTVSVFVRLSGCSLHCTWCDTDHSEKFKATEQDIVNLIEREDPNPSHIVLTGGEPTIHNLEPLLKALWTKWRGVRIAIETNGTGKMKGIFLPYWSRGDLWITISPKNETPNKILSKSIRSANEIKVVFDGVAVPDRIIKLVKRYCDKNKAPHLYIQPCSENFKPALDYVLAHPVWKLGIQVQKIIHVR